MFFSSKSGAGNTRYLHLSIPYTDSLLVTFTFAWSVILAVLLSALLIWHSLNWISFLVAGSLLGFTAILQIGYFWDTRSIFPWQWRPKNRLAYMQKQPLSEDKDENALDKHLLLRATQTAMAFEIPFQHIGVHTEAYRQEIEEAVSMLYCQNADADHHALSLCLHRLLQEARQNWSELAAFSPREREILALLLQNISYKEMGNRLHVSISTIKTHVYHVFQKLNISNREEAISIIRERGWFLSDEYGLSSSNISCPCKGNNANASCRLQH